MEINVHAFSAALRFDAATAGCFLSLAGAARRRAGMKTQGSEFLREPVDGALERVETAESAA